MNSTGRVQQAHSHLPAVGDQQMRHICEKGSNEVNTPTGMQQAPSYLPAVVNDEQLRRQPASCQAAQALNQAPR